MEFTCKDKIKLVAFDLDGTLTQHKYPLDEKNKKVLLELQKKYKLLMVGAGTCTRIFNQLEKFPIDIIGNYGLQQAVYDPAIQDIKIVKNLVFDCDKEVVEERITRLRKKFNLLNFTGDSVQYHESGAVTFPILGTKAQLEDKLKYDPTREKRRPMYNDVKNAFPEYTVFIGGSSSFDMAPQGYNKFVALDSYCKENNLTHQNVAFVGDDYGVGGNDNAVYESDFPFIKVDNYLNFEDVMNKTLL